MSNQDFVNIVNLCLIKIFSNTTDYIISSKVESAIGRSGESITITDPPTIPEATTLVFLFL